MKRRIAFVLVILIPTITIQILLGWGLYTYEMKFIRDAIKIAEFMLFVGVPFSAFLWAMITLVDSDKPYIVKNKR